MYVQLCTHYDDDDNEVDDTFNVKCGKLRK